MLRRIIIHFEYKPKQNEPKKQKEKAIPSLKIVYLMNKIQKITSKIIFFFASKFYFRLT